MNDKRRAGAPRSYRPSRHHSQVTSSGGLVPALTQEFLPLLRGILSAPLTYYYNHSSIYYFALLTSLQRIYRTVFNCLLRNTQITYCNYFEFKTYTIFWPK